MNSPALERLEGRNVLSALAVTPTIPRALATRPPAVGAAIPGDINGDGRVDLADERIFVAAFGAKFGSPRYNPAADLNHNGFVGQGDGRIILHNLTVRPRRTPLSIEVHLAPGDQALPPLSQISGGQTHRRDVTIIGRTVPMSLVFSDTGAADFSFAGPAFVADERGFFTYPVHLTDALTNFEFLAVDPFGRQTIRSFPILLKLH